MSPNKSSRKPVHRTKAAPRKKDLAPPNQVNRASSADADEDEFSKLVQKSRDKRHHSKKVAWQGVDYANAPGIPKRVEESESKARRPPSDEQLFTRVNQSTGVSTKSKHDVDDRRGTVSTSARFNAILERLRLDD